VKNTRTTWRIRQSRYIVMLTEEVADMRGLARLLFGPDGDKLLDALGPESGERRMAARVEEAGEWCQSTPSADSIRWVAAPRARRRTATPRPKHR
jgi:hypothetical protein